MIPDFITYPSCPWPLLPPGVHDASLEEIYDRFVTNERRGDLFTGLEKGTNNLFAGGCIEIFLDGSYVTAKPNPGDYDVAWNVQGVNPRDIDPIFLVFDNLREAQKKKYLGEYLPIIFSPIAATSETFRLFQRDKLTGNPKGIIRIKK